MRLIRKKAAIDSIVSYDDAAKKLADQQGYYELYQNQCATTSLSLFNYRKFNFIRSHFAVPVKDTSYMLLSRNKAVCMEFGNRVLLYAGVVRFYNIRLLEMKDRAVALIATLKKEYGIED